MFWKTRNQSVKEEGEFGGVRAAKGSSLVRMENWPLDLATWRSTVTSTQANW